MIPWLAREGWEGMVGEEDEGRGRGSEEARSWPTFASPTASEGGRGGPSLVRLVAILLRARRPLPLELGEFTLFRLEPALPQVVPVFRRYPYC